MRNLYKYVLQTPKEEIAVLIRALSPEKTDPEEEAPDGELTYEPIKPEQGSFEGPTVSY